MKGYYSKIRELEKELERAKRYIASYVVKEKILTIGRALLCLPSVWT